MTSDDKKGKNSGGKDNNKNSNRPSNVIDLIAEKLSLKTRNIKKNKKEKVDNNSIKSQKDSNINSNEFKNRAKILSEALPFMKEFSGEIFVIKFGGSAMGDQQSIETFARDVVLLKQVGINPIVVHGGGPQIGNMLERLNIKTSFIDGLRVTNKDAIEVVEMVLSGSINKNLVAEINKQGGMGVGLSGKDSNLILAKKTTRIKKDPDSNIEKILNLGYVGEPIAIQPKILIDLMHISDAIPVIAPIGIGKRGETYNINADTVAAAIAISLKASKFILLSDVDGVLSPEGELISFLKSSTAIDMINKNIIKGGMIPKIENCIMSLNEGVESIHILNGSVPHVLLMEIFTESGIGTMINKDDNSNT